MRYQVHTLLPYGENAEIAEMAYVQPVSERSGAGVEPTHRWATPVSPVLKVCYGRSIWGLKRGFGPASVLLRPARFAETGTNSGTKFVDEAEAHRDGRDAT